MIVVTIDIDRPPQEVFSYLDDLERHSDWQPDIVESRRTTEGPTRVGTRTVETRKVPGGPRDFTLESTSRRGTRLGAVWMGPFVQWVRWTSSRWTGARAHGSPPVWNSRAMGWAS
jgi:Polyketide cyclase / dehydrase and lipid transport